MCWSTKTNGWVSSGKVGESNNLLDYYIDWDIIQPSYEHFYNVRIDYEYLGTLTVEEFMNNIANIRNTSLNEILDVRNKWDHDIKWRRQLKGQDWVNAHNAQLKVKKGLLPKITNFR